MFTAGPNNNLLLTEATEMDTHGCEMLNDSTFARFYNGGCRGSAWGPNEEFEILQLWYFWRYKITAVTCLLGSEGCDSFPKHIGLALVPNKTNEGVKKQGNIQ